MLATTIKLESELLKGIISLKPRETSITAFVRQILEKEIRRQKMADSAEAYAKFLAQNPPEDLMLKEWEEADLVSPVVPGKKAKRKAK